MSYATTAVKNGTRMNPRNSPRAASWLAARAVIANWENGDLAAAVRELAAAVKLA